MGEDREWLRTWVNSESEKNRQPMSPRNVERALDIAESAFRGNTGVGVAARIGIDAVKTLEKNERI